MTFVAVVAALIAVIGGVLWFTGWAEETIVSPEAQPMEAKTR